MARVARRTGNEFYGCARYPKCSYTTNHKPVGATHEADGGPVALCPEGALCLKCGAPVELPDPVVVGALLPGGAPDPAAVAQKPKRAAGARSRSASSGASKPRARPRTTAPAA